MLYLLLDSQYLAHRAFHVVGKLQHEGEASGVAFGVLRDVENLVDQFGPDRIVHAWDYGGPGLRGALNENYKISRRNREMDEEEEKSRELFYRQIHMLRGRYLPAMGFKNIFAVRGYEADDIIAYVAENLNGNDEAVIVSADKDLWQCITPKVCCYNPTTKKVLDLKAFQAEWKIDPCMWASVKALAGCNTDDVTGITGVGEVSAAAYYAGTLPDGKRKQAIMENLDVHNQNIDLVRLPFPGLKDELPGIKEDELSDEKRRKVYSKLGIRTRERRSSPSGGFFEG